MRASALFVVAALAACGGGFPMDAGTDAGPVDSGQPDAGRADAGVDAGARDSGTPDTGQVDAGPADAGPFDAGSADAGSADAGAPDAGSACGNGDLDGTETCDDENVTAGDGCSATCSTETGFNCTGTPSVCRAICGDGVILGAETCDDDDADPGDGCSATCAVEPGYTCTGTPSVCVTTCGDGVRAGAEACDDGNVMPGDGCTGCMVDPNWTCSTATPNVCRPVCGDNLIIAPETCDDGDALGNDGCSPTCQVESGYVCSGTPSVCSPRCSDGLIVGAEECDDMGLVAGDGCSPVCRIETGFDCAGIPSTCNPICGNGVRHGAEGCDDGDLDPFDGCSASCQVETGYTCSGTPSACAPLCGDGIVLGGEQCDDGNMAPGDGCTGCRVDPGASCSGQPSVCTSRGLVNGVSMNGVGVDNGHGCLTTTTGIVFCWGINADGQVGDGTTVGPVFEPVQVPISNVIAVASGETVACALRDAGTVACWGDNAEQALGQPGRTTASDSPLPLDVPGVAGAVELQAGDDFVCARLSSGDVMCWGDNDNRQLGRGGTSTTDSDTAALVGGLSNAVRLAAGGDHACAINSSGALLCWGDAAVGQQGNGSVTTDVSTPAPVGSLTNVVDVALGHQHTCAVTAGGQLYCWGASANGRLGLPLQADGGLVPNQNTPQQVPSLSNVASVAAGTRHTCATLASGAVYCWGDGSRGQLGYGAPLDRPEPTQVAGLPPGPAVLDLGEETTCAVYSNGERWCWGQSEDAQLGLGPVAPLRTTAPTAVALPPVTTLAVTRQTYRYGHTCAIVTGNELYCWGENTAGELGDGTNFPRLVPQRVSVGAPVIDVAVTMQNATSPTATTINSGSTCAVLMTGEVMCWGGNVRGMLGDGTTNSRPTPGLAATGMVPAVQIVAGQDFYCSRHNDGTVRCWGDNSNGQIGVTASTTVVQPTPLLISGINSAIDLAAGEDHVCALLNGGAVSCWGNGANGQLGQGNTTSSIAALPVPGVANVVQLSLGQDHSCARTQAGSIICWGENGFSQMGNGSTTDLLSPTTLAAFQTSSWIAAGNNFNCSVVAATGQVQCAGYALDGHFGDGGGTNSYSAPILMPGIAGVSRVVGVNSGSFLVTPTGAVQALGFTAFGQLGIGRTLRPTRPLLAPF